MLKINYINPIPKSLDPNHSGYRKVLCANFNLFKSQGSSMARTIDFDFGGYENIANKRIIRNITSGRCAYCGLRVIDSSQLEVEHYRPKKRLDISSHEFGLHKNSNYVMVKKRSHKVDFGYFIFGNHYKNLLPACSVCNKGIDGGTIIIGREFHSNISFGKRNYFPVYYKKVAGRRVDYRVGECAINNIFGETPLLFNPYKDDPCSLFSYKKRVNVQGGFYIKICARKNINKVERLKAVITINLLGLNRIGLCSKRYDIYEGLLQLKKNIMMDKNINNSKVIIWASHAINCVKYFDFTMGSLIGYAYHIAGSLPSQLRNIIRTLFEIESQTILTDDETFYTIIEELRLFGCTFYDEQQFNNIEVDIEDFDI